MPRSSPTSLHGNVPDRCNAALILIDVINDFEFPGAEKLLRSALPMAKKLSSLKERVARAGIPSIYVNDNFGKWKSDFRSIVKHAADGSVRGHPIARLLIPAEDDYFVLKPKHSGFYSTALDLLLTHLETRTLILTGVTVDICVLFTANDAYMRGYELVIPSDCVAAETSKIKKEAVDLMKKRLKARILSSSNIDLKKLAQKKTIGKTR